MKRLLPLSLLLLALISCKKKEEFQPIDCK